MPKSRPAAAEQPSLPAQVLRRFRVVFSAVRSHFHQIEQQTGLGGAQVWALDLVRRQPGIGVGSLARCMDIHQSTASNLVRALQQRDLITTARSTEDRRSVLLHVTPAGRAVLKQVAGPLEGVLPGALGALPTATLVRLDQDLGELIQMLEADESAEGLPLAHL